MLKGEDIICITNTSLFGNYIKAVVQIMERLANDNRVLFVEYPYTIKDVFATSKGKQKAPVARMLGFEKRLQEVQCSNGSKIFHLVMPPGLPLRFLKSEFLFNLLLPINVLIYKLTLKRAMKQLGFTNPIVVNAYNPIYGVALLRKLNEKKHIYFCYDGYDVNYYGKRILSFDKTFSENVDAVITTSDFLRNEKLVFNKASFVVKNGVDFPIFSPFSKKEVASRDRKIVGYIGSLDSRIDIDIVVFAIKSLPQFDFEFTGELRNTRIKETLEKFPNVKFYSPIKSSDVPAKLATYDVGIIPYLAIDINKNIYPLKINEYLAVGVPIVMNNFAFLQEFNGVVSVASTKEEFAQMLVSELESDTIEKINARILYASKNSWEARSEEFGNIISNV
jgi:glycosyltransferase involved in cell wall biosynthesis